jgi:DNA-binding transcriptional ArsR family regulator
MSSGISSLHKILKDGTRRQIILLLNQQGNLSYTQLLDSLDAVSTGLLNYHLKVLGDLLEKNGLGQYVLSEKGKIAYNLLVEFPEDSQKQKQIWQRRFFICLGVGQVLYSAIALTFYYLNYIDLYRLTTVTVGFVVMSVTLYLIWRMVRAGMLSAGSVQMQKRIKVAYICGGFSLGLLLPFIGVGVVLRLISDVQGIGFTGQNPLYLFYHSTPYLVFSMLIAPVIGAYL